MADTSSFDVASQSIFRKSTTPSTRRRRRGRPRFKGATAEIALNAVEKTLTLTADDEMKMNALWEIIQIRLVRRNVAIRTSRRRRASRPRVARFGALSPSSRSDTEMVKYRGQKMKKSTSIQANQVRVGSGMRRTSCRPRCRRCAATMLILVTHFFSFFSFSLFPFDRRKKSIFVT